MTDLNDLNMNNLITDNIDVWTSAIKKKSATGRGSSKKIELTGVKKLRELILELAVRGKLVPQDPNDEPASVLLERIAEEKAQLIAEKKIKKQKVLPTIADEDKPFELPEGWEWCSNLVLFYLTKGKKPKNLSENNIGFPYLDIEALDRNNTLRFTDDNKCPMSTSEDLIVVCDGSRSGLVLDGKDGVIGSTLAIINTPRYIQTFIKLFFQQAFQRLNSSMKGAAIPHLDTKALREGYLALPPLTEQHRIVAKVDELMALCDQLEQQTEQSLTAHQTLVEALLNTLTQSINADDLTAMDGGNEGTAGATFLKSSFQENWQRIADHFDILFTTETSIDQLKQTILQLAVMGKLVPQNPSDEPASKLLEKIAEEKAQLIADKKIKKQKPLPAITEEEKPFELPNSWALERIGTFGIVGTGSTPSRSNPDYWQPAEYNWVSSGETSDFFLNETKEKVSALALKETNVSLYPPGTLVVAMYGQGKTRGQITELLNEAGTNQACAAIRLVNDSKHHKDYVKLCFRKAYAELRSHAAGGAQPNLNVGKISNTVLPLPPLAEQHRIVAKVDELMALCDQLKIRLADAQITQLHLADAVVENALSTK